MVRTTKSTVTLSQPFRIRQTGEVVPPGTYDVETDEDGIEGNQHTVFRRIATLLIVRGAGIRRTVSVDPDDLRIASASPPIAQG